MPIFSVGAGIFRFTLAFLRGSESFSPLHVAMHLLDFPILSGDGTEPFGTLAFATAPLPLRPFLTRRGGPSEGRMFSDAIGRILFSARCLSASLGRFAESLVRLTVILGSSGLPVEAGFLPGVALPPLASTLASKTGERSVFLSCTRWIRSFHARFRRSPVGLISRLSLFQGSPLRPFSLVYEPPGFASCGGFLTPQAESPSKMRPPNSRRNPFLHPHTHFTVYRVAVGSLANRFQVPESPQLVSKQPTF